MLIRDFTMTYGEYDALPCEAPCSMYSVLLQHGLIDDPFYGLNELKYTKLSDKPCRFDAVFTVSAEDHRKQYQRLTFEGLDTICTVYLNGRHLASTINMHRSYSYEVKELLQVGENTLTFVFDSPTEYFKEWNNKHFLWTNPDTIKGAAHLRKALYMSGWDWGPKLPDMGIFRDVRLDCYDCDRLDDILMLQHHENGVVRLEFRVTTLHHTDAQIKVAVDGKELTLVDGKGMLTVEDPKLWWVRGYGDQPLYTVEFTLVKDGKTLDQTQKRIGLRTLTVSTAKDKVGNEFCFVNNGVKIFSMGANYVPEDNLVSRVNKETHRKVLEACVDANYNSIRIWGGGYYPSDDFYDLCDEYGLVVWQDFMLACVNVWLREAFKTEFVAEAIENMKRLRHHASLGLLCGNNEMETAVMNWDGVGDSALVKMDYLELYERILPDLCETYAPQTFYWPSSPSNGGGFDDPNDETRGDVHYWSVWHGGIPFTDYRNHTFRFCSEYGFESFPSIKTIDYFSEQSDRNPFSRVMENHQKCKGGNTKILTYLADTYLYPYDFENLVYASQLLQAKAIKYGVEHFRRERGICMGSIYWQCNDCWPVASWSSIDSFGRYKALHYAAKKFYAPVAMGLFLEDGKLTVNVSNETRNDFSGRVKIGVCGNDLTALYETECSAKVAALTSGDVFSFIPQVEDVYGNYVYADLYDEHGTFIMRQTELFTEPKHYDFKKPTITAAAAGKAENGVYLDITSDVFAKDVMLDFASFDAVLSDNYFDLTDSKPYRVLVRTEKDLDTVLAELTVKTVYEIGREKE